MAKLVVDNQEIEVAGGITLLQACLDNGIYIPNLCHIKGMPEPSASCRLCFVELDGMTGPVPSCTIMVRDGLAARTDTPAVRSLQRSAFRLLMSVHDVECGNCPANKKCELQRMARFLQVGLKPKNLPLYLKEPGIVRDHPALDYYPNRCVLCGKCIHVCRTKHGRPMMTFAKRGFDMVVSFYGEDTGLILPCQGCLACVEICPVAAIIFTNRNVGVV